MKVVLSGEAWINIRQGLFPDDVVKLRATARCWNNGELFGDLGDLFFMLLKMKQYTSFEGGRAPLRLRNPFMETIRLRGTDPPSGETTDDTSFSNILTAWGNGRWYFEGHSTLTQHEDMGASRSESSGSTSPDLGETWAYGCPKSPTCGSQSDFEERSEVSGHEDEDENVPYLLCEKVVDRMRSVLDGAPWSYISPFLDLSDTF